MEHPLGMRAPATKTPRDILLPWEYRSKSPTVAEPRPPFRRQYPRIEPTVITKTERNCYCFTPALALRGRMFRTVVAPHRPPRAVGMPRKFSASASATWLVTPAFRRPSIIGCMRSAKPSAAARLAAWPIVAAGPGLGLPSFTPCAFFRS